EKLWENNEKLWQEVKSLREGQEKLWENNEKLWQEVKSLREGQEKLWENYNTLSKKVGRLEVEVDSFGKAVGRTLEDYTSSFVKIMLEDEGYDEKALDIGRRVLISGGKQVEIDVFNEEPLVVGEVTTYLPGREEAEKEVEKLKERVEIAEKLFGKQVKLKLLSVGNAPKDAVDYLREECRQDGITLVYGKELVDRA
ncbi:MAG: hypothetical protein ACP5T2_06315, partial [Thermoprotei archaeon]